MAYGVALIISFTFERILLLMCSIGKYDSVFWAVISSNCIFSRIFTHSRNNLRHTSNSYPYDEAIQAVQKSNYIRQLDGSEVIDVNQVRIISSADGAIR